ncbi:MAG: lysine--tRNA ligase [Candidatus Bathyarchaeota archaeon]|jgi:lysyl-tRNA synthetase class 1|nr:lysine--tRNA ligase [Candidatus Bathyarchaeota archaeon A05DMB-3]MDH7607717.1 lysine--tRNA ligase [Candidatus Bathyarchaeota archaeon]
MNNKIIGRGTWYDKMAAKVVERERKLGRSLDVIRTEMGLGASGFPHIGSLGDAARAYAVTLALREQGYRSELIAFCDDKDGLRKVPAGLPKSLEKYLGFPVTDIPDPFKCHESYGKHMSSLLLEALDKCGIEYHYVSAKDAYEKGLLNNEIRKLLLDAKKVGEIVKEEVGQERYTEVLPYFPICGNCGRIYTTKALEFLPDENKVLYVCEGMEIKGRWIEGCGHKGEVNITKGEGKLSWKGEFAARWKALNISFEAYGKDIADSVRVNDRISREILGYEPPSHARYEMFLDKSGKKISKSTGNVFTPQVWFRYGSPQSLMLLMLKRFVGTRTLDVTDIPSYMNKLDYLEDIYFGKKTLKDKRELTKLKGLYEYCWVLKPPPKPSVHVPYNMLAFLAKIAPKDKEMDFITEKLQSYSYLQKGQQPDENLKKRMEYAINWVRDFEEIKETAVTLKTEERNAIKELIQALKTEEDPEKIQNAIFNTAKKHGIPPPEFFKTLYTILIGTPQGPRLGPYIIAMGKQNVIEALQRALSK